MTDSRRTRAASRLRQVATAISRRDMSEVQSIASDAKDEVNFRHTKTHIFAFAAMALITIIGSTVLSTIHPETLKPGPRFPLWLKQVAYVTNVPIKAGALHFALYCLEWAREDMDSFDAHVGQRMSTLWFQFIQHPRWGQHLHMQYETVLQVVDLIKGSVLPRPNGKEIIREKMTAKYLKPAALSFLSGVVLMMAVQNFITSCAYHTFGEQMMGLALATLKIVFDYTHLGSEINGAVGECVNSASNMLIGSILVLIAAIVLGITNPAVHATLLYIGCYVNYKYEWVRQVDVRNFVKDQVSTNKSR